MAGTAIFLTSDAALAPVALMHNLKHNKMLHEKNIILTVNTANIPRVAADQRVDVVQLNEDFTKVTLSYGFMESPNIPQALGLCRKHGAEVRHHGHQLLHRQALGGAVGQFWNAGLAGQAVHFPDEKCHQPDRILPYPAGSRGRTRHAGDSLTRVQALLTRKFHIFGLASGGLKP